MIPDKFRIKNTVKHPTSLLIGGLSKLGIEIAEALLEQGGYVIIVDNYSEKEIKISQIFPEGSMFSFVDYTVLPHIDEEIRRLDYVFFFLKESVDPSKKITTQEFLNFSNYLDSALSIASKFEAKFLLSTSIRAHQNLILNSDISIKNPKDTFYTETEIQRYAESLTLEYVDRVDLDARITRIGQIIGDAVDLGIKSKFNELVIACAKNEPMVLQKDGLETEWLVHLLDAAYGVIKAQFSKETKGEIYSICYENPFTHLSIAYKIQEVEDGVQEIIFEDQKDNLPSLRVYQPAKNLSVIGWMPRIPFDRAVKQSIVSAKIYVLEQQKQLEDQEESTFIEKIKSFVSISSTNSLKNKKQISYDDIEGLGPISKLMAERKRQEEIRAKSMELANTSIKIKRRLKPKTFREKLQDQIWQLTTDIGKKISFFKNKSPVEFFFIIFVLTFVLFWYVVLASPILSIGRSIFFISTNLSKIPKSFVEYKFLDAKKNIEFVCTEIKSIRKSINFLETAFSIFALQTQYNNYKKNAELYTNLCDYSIKILETLLPIETYFSQFKNNTQVRLSSENYLSVVNLGIDHSLVFEEFIQNYPFLEFYINKIIELKTEIINFDYQYYPIFFVNNLKNINDEVIEYIQYMESKKSLRFLPALLGLNDAKTYALVLLDNTRPMPIGGDVLSIAIFSLKNGSMLQSFIQSPYDLNFDFSNITTDDLAEINLRRYNYIQLNNIKFTDIASIEDSDLFFTILNKITTKNFNKKLDGLVIINLSFLQDLLKFFKENNIEDSLDIVGTNFIESNILNNFKIATSSNETIPEKSRISSQLMANIVFKLADNFSNINQKWFNLFNKSIQNRDIKIFLTNKDFQKFINNISLINNTEKNIKISSGLILNDPNFVNSDKFPSTIKNVVYSISSDLKLNGKYIVKMLSHQTYKEIYICLPLEIPTVDISFSKIPSSQVAINLGKREKCLVGMAPIENEFEVNFNSNLLNFALLNQNEFEFNFYFPKTKGLFNSIDVDLQVSTSLPLLKIFPDIILQEGKGLYSAENINDLVIKLVVAN